MKKKLSSLKQYCIQYQNQLVIVFLTLMVIYISMQMFNYQGNYQRLKTEFSNYQKETSNYPTLKKDYDSLMILKDSLNDELFLLNTEATRHEITREEIFLKYPKIREEYEYFISHYTE